MSRQIFKEYLARDEKECHLLYIDSGQGMEDAIVIEVLFSDKAMQMEVMMGHITPDLNRYNRLWDNP